MYRCGSCNSVNVKGYYPALVERLQDGSDNLDSYDDDEVDYLRGY